MSESARSLVPAIAGGAFALFLLFKLLVPALGRDPRAREARQRVAEAKRRGSDRAASPALRAAALREAAVIALEDLRQPNLAASYALRAQRLDPNDAEAVGVLATALRRASRWAALERVMWRKLADCEPDSDVYRRAFDELLRLYDGQLRRPEVAQALRRLSSRG